MNVRADSVTETAYIEGDFSETYESLQDLDKAPPKYSLYWRNCYQVTTTALAESDSSYLRYMHAWPNLGYAALKVGKKDSLIISTK